MTQKIMAEEKLREEWDLLKTSDLLCQLGCSAGPIKKSKGIYDYFKWNALISGPKNSPYKGYMFKFEITFKEDYPDSAPIVTCKTPIYHMNISLSGDVCVDSIKKGKDWERAKDICSVLKSIFIILGKPYPQSPYRSDLAQIFEKSKEEYEKNVREECEKSAIKIP